MEKGMRTLFCLTVCVLLLSACASGDSTSATATAPEVRVAGKYAVEMRANSFLPQHLVVKVGSTITWTNMDFTQHGVESDNGVVKSPALGSGQSFSFTFDAPGDYPYFCPEHGGPGGKGMSGTITVVP